jgi:hypothetical protein
MRIYGLSIDDLTEGGFGILGRNLTVAVAESYSEHCAPATSTSDSYSAQRDIAAPGGVM